MITQSDIDASVHPTLAAGCLYAQAQLERAESALATRASRLEAIETIALGGSLGRLEAHAQSDIDCIIVARPAPDAEQLALAVEQVFAALATLNLKPPKTWGIYREPVTREALLARPALGSLHEPAAVFGKRMQLLLDARPVFRHRACTELQRQIVDWYGAGYLDTDARRSWTYLLNDLTRYLHAYAGWQQYKFDLAADDSWLLRQAKFRSSRLVTFAGLLCLLGESNARADKREWLVARLSLTPLERLALVMQRYDSSAFARLLAAYEATQAALVEPTSRARLVAGGPRQLDQVAPGTTGAASSSRDAQRELSRVLTAFVLARVDDWDPRFFERLVF